MKTNPPRFVVCLNADGHPLDLTLHKIYRTIPDDRAHDVSCYRIIDDTDEDYLYPTHRFAPIELPVTLQASSNVPRRPALPDAVRHSRIRQLHLSMST